LAVLLTSLEVEEEAALTVPDRCGSCRRCLEACPTGALTAPYQMDAARCISYLTIEHRGAIDAGLMEGMGRQVFGCDICQDVCPWNSLRRVVVSADPEMEARGELVNPALEWLAGMDEAEFERWFNGSPVRRAGFLGLRRNLAVAMGNSGMGRFVARLEEWVGDADEGVRSAAVWALGKLRGVR
jgi:epoxyqueuosine reductase